MRLFARLRQIGQGTRQPESAMPLWKLQPLDLGDPNWEASSHRGVVIVRAPDEATARDAAQRAFAVKTRFSPRAGVRTPPWKRASLSSAERVRDQRYEEEGATEVLEPAFTLPPA
jgi:hypothetical protein